MKEIIALKGRKNCGKTQTVKKVFAFLKEKYDTDAEKIIDEGNDITVIIRINGIRIGIESQGDPNSRLKNSLLLFDNEKCQIMICACRTSGMTVRWINSYSEYKKIWIKQKYCNEDEQKSNNDSKASQILMMIEDRINKGTEGKSNEIT